MTHQNLKSSKIQLFFFTVAPCIMVYAAIILIFLPFTWAESAMIPVIGIAVIWSLLGGFICAANQSLISAIGEPQQPVVNITIGTNKITAVSGMEYSSSQKVQFYSNVFFAVIFAVPVAVIGWLMFVLYCKGIFLKKLKAMSDDLDRVFDIIYEGCTDIKEISYYFYRMLDYVEVYKKLNERKGANKMLNKAEQLLRLWESLESKTEQTES